MKTLYLILYIVSAACFLLAAWLTSRPQTATAPARPVPNLVALGLLAWVLIPLIVTARSL